MRFSDKQYRAATFGEREGRNFVFCGPIRSGKSASGLRGFLHWAGNNFSGLDFCLAAKSSKQWDAVIFGPMREWCESVQINLRRREEYWEVEDAHGGTNRFWRVIGGDGEKSSARIEGMTFAGAYIDDACFHPPILLKTISDRCSVQGAKLVFTCYPQGPFHPFKLDYVDEIENETKSGEVISFSLADNPSLGAEYLENLRATWAPFPHEYARRIEGRWVASSGLIYPGFQDYVLSRVEAGIEPTIMQWDVCADWASSSVTHGLLIGTASDGLRYVWDEWRHDGRSHGLLPTDRQADAMVAKLTDKGNRSIRNWICDPSSDGLMLALRDRVQGNVVPGVAKVDEGLRATALWIDSGRMRFLRKGVPALLKEMGSYSWDEKAMGQGEDRPDKDSADGAHGCDALRYYCHTMRVAESKGNFHATLH